MTRTEYKTRAEILFPDAPPDYINRLTNFPTLLSVCAVELFMQQDTTSELAAETRRRLTQLRETGMTDQ